METGKTGKYFKYAIGEIILVVIGILIALQINNWNQNRLDRHIERDTLINLRLDLHSAMAQLDNKIMQNNLYRFYDSTAMELIHSKTEVPNDSITKLLLAHIFTPTFDPELGTLNEILNTGKMEIIQNKSLRKHISSWNRYMDELSEVDNRLIYLDDNFKTPLYMKILPYRNSFNYVIKPNSASLLAEPLPSSNFQSLPNEFFYTMEFESMLANYLIYGIVQGERLDDIKTKIIDMIALIDKMIKPD
ncbi:DUF6090 family protein [Winogradskyella aurantia]|nr:DUF6090 family protein [Winogradskyella aurantia]